jgi:hypothetical protein
MGVTRSPSGDLRAGPCRGESTPEALPYYVHRPWQYSLHTLEHNRIS